MAGQAPADAPAGDDAVPAGPAASHRGAVRLPQPARTQAASQRLVMPQRKLTVRTGQHLVPAEPLLEQVKLPETEPKFDKLARDITDMVPV